MGGGRRRRADDAPVGSPSISSPTVGAVAPRAVVLRSPTTNSTTIVRNLWRQTQRWCRPPVLRAAALQRLWHAAPVSPL